MNNIINNKYQLLLPPNVFVMKLYLSISITISTGIVLTITIYLIIQH